MIKNSFIFLDRFGKRREQRLWHDGIKCWDDFLNSENIHGISSKAKKYYDNVLIAASRAIKQGDSGFFTDKLGLGEAWRLYSTFGDEAVFLDIESTGVKQKDEVIVVGLFDGIRDKVMIKGVNLNLNILKEELKRYKLIITYNGASFDIPFIKKRHPDLIPKIPHIDLQPICSRLGFKDGLKEIEKRFKIVRNPLLDRLYGGDVYRLWRMYFASGDRDYLNLLAEYNQEDVINLKRISDFVIPANEKRLFNPASPVSFQ